MATVDNGGVSSQDLAVPLLDTYSREPKTQTHVHELSHGVMGTTQTSTDYQTLSSYPLWNVMGHKKA